MLIVDLSLARVVQHSVLCLAYTRVVSQIDGAVGRMRMRMTTITLHVKNLTLSSLK